MREGAADQDPRLSPLRSAISDPRPLPHRRLQIRIEYVGVDHRRAQVGMPEGLLHEPDVGGL